MTASEQTHLPVPGLVQHICRDLQSSVMQEPPLPLTPQSAQDQVPATELLHSQQDICFQGGTFSHLLCFFSSKTLT